MNKSLDTRSALLLAARRLIAVKGVDGVSVREILEAAKVKNGGAISYYFGSKEDMIVELIEKGARLIDQRRIKLLDALEASGAPITLGAVVTIMIESSVGLSSSPKREDSYHRFIAAVQSTHFELFKSVVGRRLDTGRRRLVAHIREILADVPEETLNQRLIFAHEFITTILAKREGSVVEHERGAYWRQPLVVDHLITSVVGMLYGTAAEAYERSLPRTQAQR